MVAYSGLRRPGWFAGPSKNAFQTYRIEKPDGSSVDGGKLTFGNYTRVSEEVFDCLLLCSP